MKRLLILITCTVLCLSLISCIGEKKRDAYCFSMVFDKKNNTSTVTMYCRITGVNAEEESERPLEFTGKSFSEALKEAEKSEFEIYYNSTEAILFTTSVDKEEKSEIARLLLNNTKYQVGAYIYSPENTDKSASENIHATAKEISANEGIDLSAKKDYTPFLKYFRENSRY